MGCTSSQQAQEVVAPPPELSPAVDPAKAKENARPISAVVYAFGECPDKLNEKQKKYLIFYLIKVNLEDPESKMSFQITVYRRFSQFELFRERLLKSRKFETVPALPKKYLFGKASKNNEHLTQRQKDLDLWLNGVLNLPNVLSDDVCIEFLMQEADEKPDDIAVQVHDPINLKGEQEDYHASDADSHSLSSVPDIRAVAGIVYAMGKSADENNPGRNLVFFVIRVKLEDYGNGLNSQTIVYRRFSQFEQFRERLLRSKLYESIPSLPKKKLIGKTNKNNNNLFNRQTALETWLRLICQLPNVIQDPTFQLFLTEGAGDEPFGFVFNFHDPSIVGHLSDDESSDEDDEEGSLGDDGSVEIIVHHHPYHSPVDRKGSMDLEFSGETTASACTSEPPTSTTYAYQTISGYGSGLDNTKRRKNSTCIYYAIRVHSTTRGVKGVHEMLVFRRFSQFVHLRRDLMATKLYENIPYLPKKTLFGNTRTGHMMKRKNELTAWMHSISEKLPNIVNDPCYIKFISDNADEEPENYCAHGTFVIF